MKEQEKEDWNLVHKPRKEAKDPTVQKLKVRSQGYVFTVHALYYGF